MWSIKTYFSLLFLLLCFRSSYQIACKDEKNNNVDWYVNYKIPKISSESSGSDLERGKAYAYITPSRSSWKLSKKDVVSGGSMLENTMNQFYSKKQKYTFLFYNDEPPESDTKKSSVGHLKGVLAFDCNTGFWLVHSIPKFADPDSYAYPDNALVNGQSILCVTFRTAELNEIANQLLYSHPNIYAYNLTDCVRELLDNKAKSLFTDNPSFIRKPPLTSVANLKSLNNNNFISFAKDNQFKEGKNCLINETDTDLFSDIIAPNLKSSLMVETWRRGSGTFLPPSCETEYYVIDIVSINMTLGSGRNRKYVSFKSTEDHSKWAISDGSDKSWICVADMNRMASQERRGGGALCFNSKPVKKAYQGIIAETDTCST